MKEIEAKIEEAIESAGSAYRLAKMCGCSSSAISRLRNGQRMPSMDMLARIQVVTGADMSDTVIELYKFRLSMQTMSF